ncbi:MAG TPA: hypothetical protein VKF41_04925 [Bryobacteraceae bacterium]|nr:hypothetical protein [Bryobacteraceae bacterium]
MATFLERYQDGGRVALWDDLVALGEGVRHELYYADAAAVAAETMRRARHNVELLIQRLDGMGYRFLTQEINDKNHREALGRLAVEEAADNGRAMAIEFMNNALAGQAAPLENPDVLDRPTKQTARQINKLEKWAGGPLPLSLRAWYEQVGGVSLLGWHSTLHPNADEPAGLPGTCPDPLMIWLLESVLEMVEENDDGDEEGEIRLGLAPDETFKAGEGGGGPYEMVIPNPCADGIFEDGNGRTFVGYLRNLFAWGGFPGWECDKNAPREAIAKLTEGLLPI